MARVALGLEYLGTAYVGWQRQLEGDSVQARVESALSQIADHPVRVVCAGRTDKGVHATGQVIHFDTTSERPLHAWVRGTNRYLPPDISVSWAKVVSSSFHARFAALARQYRYQIYVAPARRACWGIMATWQPYPLEVDAMRQAAQVLLGEHDFSSFRGAQCQAHSPVRTLHALDLWENDGLMILEIRANAFLHHMVRNIVGTLLPIGRGLQPPEWLRDVLEARDRRQAGVTAPPEGLCLTEVIYPNDA